MRGFSSEFGSRDTRGARSMSLLLFVAVAVLVLAASCGGGSSTGSGKNATEPVDAVPGLADDDREAPADVAESDAGSDKARDASQGSVVGLSADGASTRVAGAALAGIGVTSSGPRDGVVGAGSASPFRCAELSRDGAIAVTVVSGTPCPSRSSTETAPKAVGDADARAASTDDTTSPMVWQRSAALSGCAALFVAPGERIALAAAGFDAGSEVTFSVHMVSLGDAAPSASTLPATMADSQGAIEVWWTVPTSPSPQVDAVPRGYAVVATGVNPQGTTHTSMFVAAVVTYPGTAPCAYADSASTSLGTAVQISVLSNDNAPTGGTLDLSSVVVRAAVGGTFSADTATGVVTFTPDAGFWGTVQTTYVVYDGWGMGVRADLTITVDAGCTITGTVGVELIEGTEGDDVICVPDRDDWRAFHIIDAKGGDDVILGGAGVEWVYGGDGADTIYGNGGDDRIVAGAGVDTVYGGSGMDSVHSVDTADTVIDDDYDLVVAPSVAIAQSGPEPTGDWVWIDVSETVQIDVLGNDHDPNEDLVPATLTVTTAPSSGTVVVTADADGVIVVEYTAPESGGSDSFAYEVCDSLGACAAAEVSVMVGTAGCTIMGTAGDDTIRGTPGDDVICGLGGDDTIRGIGGNDTIIGGPGDDDINAGDGDDIVWGGGGADTLDGGPGDDTIWGGAGDDTLLANSGADRLDGGPGIDAVTGGGGNDLIWGGSGDDTLDGHSGDDTIWGGPGVDMLRGGNGDDAVWGGADNDTLTGGAGADSLHGGAGDDRLDGNTHNDNLWGGSGDDTLDGGGHDDELHGGPGDDTLRGGAGDDRLWGGIDTDSLDGGHGVDHLDGGPDADTCARAGTAARCEGAAGSRR